MSEEVKEKLDNTGLKFKEVDENGVENFLTLSELINELETTNKKLSNYITNLQQENEQLRTELNGTTHCYDETELKAFKKKLNNIVEYCRTTQMTFEEFIELERMINE